MLKSNFTSNLRLCQFIAMNLKKFLPLLPVLLLTGCAGTFTRLTPVEQPRNANNLYPVEATFKSQQQSLRWDTIQAYVVVNDQTIPMRPVPMVKNRWEGYVPVPPTTNSVTYRFKFDYLYNRIGRGATPDSIVSPPYKLKVVEQ